MLAGQVVAPVAGELKLAAILHGLLEDADAFGIGQTDEVLLEHSFKALNEALVNHLVEELKVVLAVVQSPAHAVLDEILLQVHQFLEVHEGDFGFYHPELGQVARRVGVFGAECGAEGVDSTEGRSTELAFQLSAHSERSHFAEEIVGVVNRTLFVLLEVVEILGGHLEHLTSTFAVAGSDDGRMEIEESVLVEILVNGHGHVVANAEDCAKRVGAQTQMSVLAHILEGLPFLLHGIVCIASAEDFDRGGLNLHGLSCTLAFNQRSLYGKASARGDLLQHLIVKLIHVGHNLYVLNGRTIVEGDEVDHFAASAGTHPSFDADSCAEILTQEEFCNFCSISHDLYFQLNCLLYIWYMSETRRDYS